MADPTSRITTLTVRDRQALTTALELLEAYQAKYGWMWAEGISGDDVAAAARASLNMPNDPDHTKPLRDIYDATCRALGRARAEVDDLEAETERQRLVLIELGDTDVA